MSYDKIDKAILEYANAYEKLEGYQITDPSIPRGDQKTGSIGEYYSYRYLSSVYSTQKLEYGSHSEKGWDIRIVDCNIKVQVKTVSAFSKTRSISPIHHGWNVLHLIYLNKSFWPEGFWIIEDLSILSGKDKLAGKKCRMPGKPATGSKDIPFGENRVGELLNVLN